MPTTAQDLIYGALRYCGVTAGPNRTPSPDQLSDGLKRLNQMLGSWNIDPLMIFTKRIDVFDLIAGQLTYTIGDNGDFDTGAWVAEIDRANAILNTSSPALRVGMEIWTDQEWAGIKLQQLTGGTIPKGLYNDGAFPLSTLYIWPPANLPYQIELYWWQRLATFAATTDTVSLPDGYEEAIETNLAVRLAPTFQVQLDPTVMMLARQSKARIESKNAQAPLLVCDPALTPGRSGFDYRTGE